jgi:hypothetical protein
MKRKKRTKVGAAWRRTISDTGGDISTLWRFPLPALFLQDKEGSDWQPLFVQEGSDSQRLVMCFRSHSVCAEQPIFANNLRLYIHFLPRSHSAPSKEHGAGLRLRQTFLESCYPLFSLTQTPRIVPASDAGSLQLARDSFNLRLIGTIVAEEY